MNYRMLALLPFFAGVAALASCEDDGPRQPANGHQGGGSDTGIPEREGGTQQPEVRPEG